MDKKELFANVFRETKKHVTYLPQCNHCRQSFEIDLRQTVNQIKQKIDEQVSLNQHLLERVIEDQISEDFRNAEYQINNYIKRFQNEFDCLLIERETKQTEADKIRVTLNLQKDILSKYLHELNDICTSFNQWKPN